MELQIKNFAKIKNANLAFDGITVIAGNNNSGKSTIGKILFTLFHTLNNIEGKSFNEQKNAIIDNICTFVKHESDISSSDENNLKHELKNIFRDVKNLQRNDLIDFIYDYLNLKVYIDKVDKDLLTNKVEEVKNISDIQIEERIIENSFNEIFKNQINSLILDDSEANLTLILKGKIIFTNFKDDKLISYDKGMRINNKAFYIDRPFIIDNISRSENIYKDEMQRVLLSYLKVMKSQNIVESIVTGKKLSAIYEKLKAVLSGDFISKKGELFLKNKEFKDEINIKNISAGLKSFAIIKKLLENGSIKEKDIIILDEPEIHLHPQWQLIYAELIVLLQKTFNLTILLTTHSPFFLDAIEVFSAKHEISDRLHYYLSIIEEDKSVTFDDVTNNIEAIYAKISEPLQLLESMRYRIREGN